MPDNYILYGWKVSPYTQKTAAYLRYKGIPFTEEAPWIYKLSKQIPRHVGKMVMPVVESSDGQWWQDSSEIIDLFEQRYPENPVLPETPKQKLVANLLELHGDEWLCMSALHYRWTTPENYKFAISEFGKNSLPYAPNFLRKKVGETIGRKMRSYMPRLGIEGAAAKGLEKYTMRFLQLLEEHLKQYPFVLGTKPCLGDFALFGPLWAHLYRDPGTTCLFDNSPSVRAWFDRLLDPEAGAGEFLPDDEIPESLEPIIQSILAEQFEFCRTVIDGVDRYVESHPGAKRVSRVVGEGPFTVGGEKGHRVQLSYLQWMVQRTLLARDDVPESGRVEMNEWLKSLGGENFMNTKISHPIKRENYKEILEGSSGLNRKS
ncbi:glutathione S-transferase family protein [Parendozoicomonas sp. Alg238-R29]|uniref:glutathione S-transferase family protein n=1 Tax=Parendozoicomonas sp. Alg238-R29 TaxID=2993446 RepID=UPI00248E219F|nr:glutathione S-transferase family protein [Parendozoicomonas sp. Alg238-R29]